MARAARPELVKRFYTPAILDGIRRLTRTLRESAAETQNRTGVSAAQLYVLSALQPDRSYSIGELAELTVTDRSSVSSVVDKLSARGYVKRSWAEDDRRRAEIRITRKGRNLLVSAGSAPTGRLIEAIQQLSSAEIYGLAEGLLRLQQALGIEDSDAELMFDD